ncbi:hypothetical protein ACFQY0_19950 [Haloferula chungangensis]|uniref:Uncharacterized protein n=1 Tax=Haloferula chungangensis TaxID=1048331 RepID=A0ABW2LD94_9BACT
MKRTAIVKGLVGIAAVAAVGFELGLFQRVFDSRSLVEDGVLGSDYWIVEVDGKPTERIQHGIVISKVPLALLEPGDRILELSDTPHPQEGAETIQFHTTIKSGVDYRIDTSADGSPKLIAK